MTDSTPATAALCPRCSEPWGMDGETVCRSCGLDGVFAAREAAASVIRAMNERRADGRA